MVRNYTLIFANDITLSSGTRKNGKPNIEQYNFFKDRQFNKKFKKNKKVAFRYVKRKINEMHRKGVTSTYINVKHSTLIELAHCANFESVDDYIDFLIYLGYNIVFVYLENSNSFKIYRTNFCELHKVELKDK